MATWTIRRYTAEDKALWDRMVSESRNGSFLFMRRYMDYHADRFSDHSLIAEKGGKPIAILPANISSDTVLHSHQGLTYGGWVLPVKHFNGVDMVAMWDAWINYCRAEGFKGIDYKPIPTIYHLSPSQEDLYMLFRSDAKQSACGLSSTIDYAANRGFNTLQKRLLRNGLANGITVHETDNVDAFWQMLHDCLSERHDVAPVHSSAELHLLKERFPSEIKIYVAESDGEMLAGVCMYLTKTVAHSQYICSTTQGRDLNALPVLFDQLITLYGSEGYKYFDFGISTEDSGYLLNEGLHLQKTGFGGSGVVYSRYFIDLEDK